MSDSSFNSFVLFLAGFGGFMFVVVVMGICTYVILYLNMKLVNVIFIMLWLGIILSFTFISVDLADLIKNDKRKIIIAHTALNSVLILLLGFTMYHYIRNDPYDRTMYMMTIIPVTLLLSVVGLSATMMHKLSSKPAA